MLSAGQLHKLVPRRDDAESSQALQDRLVANDDAALGEEILNVAKAGGKRKYSQTAWAFTSGGKQWPR